jgi:hypothetical protein
MSRSELVAVEPVLQLVVTLTSITLTCLVSASAYAGLERLELLDVAWNAIEPPVDLPVLASLHSLYVSFDQICSVLYVCPPDGGTPSLECFNICGNSVWSPIALAPVASFMKCHRFFPSPINIRQHEAWQVAKVPTRWQCAKRSCGQCSND